MKNLTRKEARAEAARWQAYGSNQPRMTRKSEQEPRKVSVALKEDPTGMLHVFFSHEVDPSYERKEGTVTAGEESKKAALTAQLSQEKRGVLGAVEPREDLPPGIEKEDVLRDGYALKGWGDETLARSAGDKMVRDYVSVADKITRGYAGEKNEPRVPAPGSTADMLGRQPARLEDHLLAFDEDGYFAEEVLRQRGEEIDPERVDRLASGEEPAADQKELSGAEAENENSSDFEMSL